MNDIHVVSYSELDTYRQCPLKHLLAYDQRWTRGVKEGSALEKGSLYHRVLEIHYKILKQVQDDNGGKVPAGMDKMVLGAIKDAIAPMLADPRTGTQTPVQELIEWMYEGYVANYGIDRDWKILGVEHQIVTPLRDERGRRSRYHLKAKIDLLISLRSNGLRAVVDHKSGKDLPTKMDLEIDDQFGLYGWAMSEVDRKVVMAMHSANRTQRNKSFMPLETRMSRTPLSRSNEELKNLALDAYRTAWNMYPPKSQIRKVYSSPDPRQCGWKCDFKEAHLLMRQGRKPAEVLREFGFKIDRTRH